MRCVSGSTDGVSSWNNQLLTGIVGALGASRRLAETGWHHGFWHCVGEDYYCLAETGWNYSLPRVFRLLNESPSENILVRHRTTLIT